MLGTTVEVFGRVKQRVAVHVHPVELDVLKPDGILRERRLGRLPQWRVGGEKIEGRSAGRGHAGRYRLLKAQPVGRSREEASLLPRQRLHAGHKGPLAAPCGNDAPQVV